MTFVTFVTLVLLLRREKMDKNNPAMIGTKLTKVTKVTAWRPREERMLRGVRHRITTLERYARGLTADVFMAHAEKLARRMGTDYRAAVAKLGNELDDYDLDRLIVELELMVYGDDTAARDAARQRALETARLNLLAELKAC